MGNLGQSSPCTKTKAQVTAVNRLLQASWRETLLLNTCGSFQGYEIAFCNHLMPDLSSHTGGKSEPTAATISEGDISLLPITWQYKGQEQKYLRLALLNLITWWSPGLVHRIQVCKLSSLGTLSRRWSLACWLFLPVTSCIDSERTVWSDLCPVFQIAAW